VRIDGEVGDGAGREVKNWVGRCEGNRFVGGSVTYFDFCGRQARTENHDSGNDVNSRLMVFSITEDIACPRRSLLSNPKKVQYHARTKGSSMPFDIGFLSLQL